MNKDCIVVELQPTSDIVVGAVLPQDFIFDREQNAQDTCNHFVGFQHFQNFYFISKGVMRCLVYLTNDPMDFGKLRH